MTEKKLNKKIQEEALHFIFRGYPRKHGENIYERTRERVYMRLQVARNSRGVSFDPWRSRWDAILFIVLIISEYIVRKPVMPLLCALCRQIREIYESEQRRDMCALARTTLHLSHETRIQHVRCVCKMKSHSICTYICLYM